VAQRARARRDLRATGASPGGEVALELAEATARG
jgi:hypothetical protein